MEESTYSLVIFPVYGPYSIAPILSTIFAAIATTYCVINKSYQDPLGFMVLAINSADFLFSFPKTLSVLIEPSGDVYCQIFHGISEFGVMSSICWSTIFAYALLVMATQLSTEVLSRRVKYYSLFAYLTAVVLSLSTVFGGFIEYQSKPNRSNECVHKITEGKLDVRGLIFFAIPLGIACVVSGVLYFKAARSLRLLLQRGQKTYLLILIVYPAIFLLCWLPYLLMSLFIILNRSPNLTLFRIVQALDQMQGFFNGLMYGGSKNLLQKICLKIYKFCCKRKATVAAHSGDNEEEEDEKIYYRESGGKESLMFDSAPKEHARNI